uniref:CSON015269 protein n=1 Tax=Culicoides sonorensis TaxID=179676 RepID=A0A336MFH3_CULSO
MRKREVNQPTQNKKRGQFTKKHFLLHDHLKLKDIPLHVLITTHVLIAWDRMRWLSDPLKGRIPAFVCSCATWLAGMVIALPYPIYTAYVDLGDIPLHVLITTHVLIAWDRMRWLSDPLKGRIPAFVCSCATWLAGMVIALPYPIYTAYVDLGVSI